MRQIHNELGITGGRSGLVKMRPRARLIHLIGEELISDESVALVELVKNAYDADASIVRVVFEGDDPKSPSRILIEDDGIGMDIDTVLDSWFEPGTVYKKRAERSPGGRTYQGAKGIGRFAAARLGESLMLETKKDGKPGVLALLSWGDFTDDSYLDEVELEYEVDLNIEIPSGTRLIIESVKEGVWQESSYKHLHARLSRLISPFHEINDFEVYLEIPGFPELSGSVEPPELLLKPIYHLKGCLDGSGIFSGKMVIGDATKEISKILSRGNEIPACGAFDVEIRAWDRDREGLEPIASREQITISQVRKTLDSYCGVSIYRDGFRVHPYGERGDDWLNLDLRSRLNPGRNLANNQIIAAIRISREDNPGLRDRSTREGMVKNSSYTALEEWFQRIITILEEARYIVRPKKEVLDRTDPLFEVFDIGDILHQAKKSLGGEHPLTKLIEVSEQKISKGVDQVQEVFSRLLMSAGLGHMIDIVIHEIGAPLGKANRELVILEKHLNKLLDESVTTVIEPSINNIRAWLEQIYQLRQRLDPQTPGRRGRATTFDVAEEITLTLELYRAMTEKQRVEIEFIAPDDPVKVKMSRAVLAQILANLVDNALYWVINRHGIGNGGNIHIVLDLIESGFIVRVSDSGAGVPDNNKEQIFEPYFSTKPNGVGLGLYIARLLIESYGRLILCDNSFLNGACFEARFEKGVGL